MYINGMIRTFLHFSEMLCCFAFSVYRKFSRYIFNYTQNGAEQYALVERIAPLEVELCNIIRQTIYYRSHTCARFGRWVVMVRQRSG